MAYRLLHKKSSLSGKTPTETQLEYGEIAINYNANSPKIHFKDSENNIVSFIDEKNIKIQINEGVNEAVSTLNGEISQITNSISTLNGEISQTKNSISTLNGEISQTKNSISTLNGEISQTKNDVSTLNEVTNKNADKIKENELVTSKALNDLNNKINTLTNNINNLNGILYNLEQRINRLESGQPSINPSVIETTLEVEGVIDNNTLTLNGNVEDNMIII